MNQPPIPPIQTETPAYTGHSASYRRKPASITMTFFAVMLYLCALACIATAIFGVVQTSQMPTREAASSMLSQAFFAGVIGIVLGAFGALMWRFRR